MVNGLARSLLIFGFLDNLLDLPLPLHGDYNPSAGLLCRLHLYSSERRGSLAIRAHFDTTICRSNPCVWNLFCSFSFFVNKELLSAHDGLIAYQNLSLGTFPLFLDKQFHAQLVNVIRSVTLLPNWSDRFLARVCMVEGSEPSIQMSFI